MVNLEMTTVGMESEKYEAVDVAIVSETRFGIIHLAWDAFWTNP